MEAKELNYSLEELASRRRIAQVELTRAIKKMKVIQEIYDRINNIHFLALKSYKKLDLEYAMKTSLIKVPKKTKSNNPRKIKRKKPNKTLEIISSLSQETQDIINKLSSTELNNIITNLRKKKKNVENK